MIKLQETTKNFSPGILHTYFLSDSKSQCFGYIKNGETEEIMFKEPQRFSTRGRTFIKLKL